MFWCAGKVIQALSEPKPGHVPYRESKLTRLLQVTQNISVFLSVPSTSFPLLFLFPYLIYIPGHVPYRESKLTRLLQVSICLYLYVSVFYLYLQVSICLYLYVSVLCLYLYVSVFCIYLYVSVFCIYLSSVSICICIFNSFFDILHGHVFHIVERAN